MLHRYCFLWLAALLCTAPLSAQKVTGVGPVCITVRHLSTALAFYTQVLPFKHLGTESFYGESQENLMGQFGIHYRIAHLQLGNERVDLIDYLTSGGHSIPETQQSNDLSFQHIAIVVSDMEKAFEWLEKREVEFVSTLPQTLPLSNKAAAGIKAFYFHDPDGHNLEIIYFPPGKGDPRWQAKPNQVFLGIDHTAIGISNTERSLQFWSSQLGLLKKGESHNLGTEQAHLNNIAGAELRITGLRAPEGAGVEFLEYLRPGPGKAYPADTRCDDLWNWLTLAYCDDAEALFKLLRTQNVSLVSSQVVQTTRGKEFIARDPDGHAVWFVQRRP